MVTCNLTQLLPNIHSTRHKPERLNRMAQKTTAAGTVYYLYDLAGHVITELNSSGGWNRGEVYAGGRHVATYVNSTTYFDHADWLGTERVRTDASGDVVETCQSLPFGDDLGCSGSDVSPLHFTGKQHDDETGLDYFGARYDASTDFAASTSAALAETINTASFTLSIPSASATVQAGQSATFPITVSPEGNLSTPVSFACSGLPSKSICTFAPSTVTPGTTATKDTLTISTTAPTTATLWPLDPSGHPNWPLFAALALLPALALLATRKRNPPARRKLRHLAWSGALALALAMTLSACGGGGGSSSSGSTTQTIAGTPAGSYQVTVTGTSGSENITAQVTLTVQ